MLSLPATALASALLLLAVESGQPLYKDPAQPIAARVADLLAKMSLEEKVNQTLNDFANGAFGGGIPTDP